MARVDARRSVAAVKHTGAVVTGAGRYRSMMQLPRISMSKYPNATVIETAISAVDRILPQPAPVIALADESKEPFFGSRFGFHANTIPLARSAVHKNNATVERLTK